MKTCFCRINNFIKFIKCNTIKMYFNEQLFFKEDGEFYSGVNGHYSGVNGKWYSKPQKKFDYLKNIYPKYYCSNYYDVSVNKYGVKVGASLRFWKSKGWINDPYGWFQWYFGYWLGRRSEDDERQINRWKKM